MAALVKQFKREIVLSAVGLVATGIAFAAGAIWGWRVLGGFLVVMALWVFWTGEAAFLLPGVKAGHLRGRNAIAAALASAAIGFLLIVNANALARWTYRTCDALQLAACQGEPQCTNRDVVSVPSPTRSVRAVKFVRSCEGKPGPSTHVSLIPMGDALPDEPGNAFIVDGDADLVLLWIEGKHLAVSGADGATPRLQKAVVNGVRISYSERRK